MPHFFSSFFHTQPITRCATERKKIKKKIPAETGETPKTKKRKPVARWGVAGFL
jgi:hypothetical protein